MSTEEKTSAISLAQLDALDANLAAATEFDRRWSDDQSKTVGERLQMMGRLADEIVGSI